MYRTKLYLAFFVLVLITVLQASLAIWSLQIARDQAERGRIANQMLSEFIALGADKQRLKVWLAQSLLTKDAPPSQRDTYLLQMQTALQSIEQLLLQDQGLATHAADFAMIAQQMKTLSILETNVDALTRSLQAQNMPQKPLAASTDEGDVWRLLIQTFDKLEGLDLKQLIAGSIDIQRQRSANAEAAATAALQQTRWLLLICGALACASAALFAFLLARSSYRPLQSLLEGTAAISRGELTYRLSEQGNAEFALLSRSFNQMAVALERAHQAEQAHSQQTELIVRERTAQLQQALSELQSAELSQKRFLADVSHELRTPATAIRGEAEVMLRGKDKSVTDYKDSLLRIVDTTMHLSHRIDELLMLVRGDSQLQTRFKPYRFVELWQQWSALIERLRLSAGVDIVWPQLTEELLQNVLFLDAERAQQAIQIVLDNAIKYGLQQSIHVQLGMQGNQLCLSFTDQGIGVPAEEFEHVFTRFYRASNARSQRPDGLGIGLSLCQSMMQAQHGSVTLVSPIDAVTQRGTRVTLAWPLASIEDEDLA